MDETLRLLLNRAQAENTAEAWRAYALGLQRIFIGTPPTSTSSEQIIDLIRGTHKSLEQLKKDVFETDLPNTGYLYHYFIVEKDHHDKHFYLTAFIILTEEASDYDWETALIVCEGLVIRLLAEAYDVNPDSLQRDHLLEFSRELRDNCGNLLCFFDGVYYID